MAMYFKTVHYLQVFRRGASFRGAMRLVAAVSAVLLPAVAACGGSSSPEGTVRRYFEALEAQDMGEIARTFIPELRESMERDTLGLPEIDIAGLDIEAVSEGAAEAVLTAEYNVDFPEPSRVKVRITLVKVGGEWLISRFDAVGPGE